MPEGEWKWVESKLPKDDHPQKADIIVSNAGEIHFIYAWKKKSVHFKVHLSQFLPKSIWKKYSKQENELYMNTDITPPPSDIDGCIKCDEYQDDVTRLEILVDDLLRNQSAIEIEKRAIERREQILKEKREEIRTELEAAKAELAKLRRKNMDTTKYMEWSAEEFVDYICTVDNGIFLKYEDILRESFKNDDVDGEAIPHLEKNEWRGFGIKNYMDRAKLHKCIKDLVNGKTLENPGGDEEEQIGLEGQTVGL